MIRHEILGGKVQLFKRGDSQYWQCSTSIGGKQHRNSTKQDSLLLAKEVAEDWYLTLKGKDRAGLIKTEKTFKQVSEKFLEEYEVLTDGQRSPRWVEGHGIRLRLHLIPFLGDLGISEVTSSKIQEYRIHRVTSRLDKVTGKPKRPSRSTMHDEIVTLRQVLKTALRHTWLDHLPDMTEPYNKSGKVVHRPWFSPAEYKQLYEATREYAKKPIYNNHKWNAEQVHDYVLFMANTGLRPDEAKNLQHRDVSIVTDKDTGERILEIEVRGKRGVGYCKSMPSAVLPYKRLLARPLPGLPQGKRARKRRGESLDTPPVAEKLKYPEPTDHVFPGNHIKLFNGVLKRTGLKKDRDGKPRTAYSLRHTYICMRLLERADVYQLAKNCRTSVEMIEKHYAVHLKNTLDAGAINRRLPKNDALPRKSVKQVNPLPEKVLQP